MLRLQQDYDRPVFGEVWRILGDVGRGKNTLAVEFIRMLSRICVHNVPIENRCQLCEKYQIENRILKAYANFDISLPGIECHYMETPDDFFAIKQSMRQHMIWIIDEPDAWGFDARRSMSDKNLTIGKKIKQCRHYNADTLILSQLNSMIDPRGRRLGDSIFALGPNSVEFQYILFIDDIEIPITLPWSWAKENVFPYYKTERIIGESLNESEDTPSLESDTGEMQF